MKNKLMLIFTAIALVLALVGCGKIETKEIPLETVIIERALADLGIEAETVELRFVEETPCAWQDGTCEEYVLIADGVEYSVGVRRDGNNVTFVDVEGEL